MNETKRAELIKSIREAAVVLVDDLAHICEILAKPEPNAGDVLVGGTAPLGPGKVASAFIKTRMRCPIAFFSKERRKF